MEKTHDHAVTAQPRLHQTAPEIQAYGSISEHLVNVPLVNAERDGRKPRTLPQATLSGALIADPG